MPCAARAAGLFYDVAGLSAALEDCRSRRAPVTLELAATPDPMPYELVISPRCDERGRMAGYVLAGRSVVKLRHAYQALERSHHELKAMQGQMVRNEKLASLGRLLAGVAHEMNNPISFVYANAHALERYATKFETHFDRVATGASRADLIALREELRLDLDLRNMREAIHGARDGAVGNCPHAAADGRARPRLRPGGQFHAARRPAAATGRARPSRRRRPHPDRRAAYRAQL